MSIDTFKKAMYLRIGVPVCIIAFATLTIFYLLKIEHYYLYPYIMTPLFIFLLWVIIVHPQYFSFNIRNNDLIFRFYTPYSLTKNYKQIIINHKELFNYQITKKFFGLRTELILTIKKGEKIGNYKPLNISLLNKNQMKSLDEKLNFIVKSNKL